MKVLLFMSGGTGTPHMRKIMQKYKGVRCRIKEIIEYIENNAYLFSCCSIADFDTARPILDNNNEALVAFEYNPQTYFYKSAYNSIETITIVDVDITRPWTITDCNGVEYIQYLDEKKLVDKELNYWKDCNYV